MEMSRQRLRTGVLEASTHSCPMCDGAGIVRSVPSAALAALRGLEADAIRGRASQFCLRAGLDVAVYILNRKRDELVDLENRYGISIEVVPDSDLIVPNFAIDSAGPAPTTRPIAAVSAPMKVEGEEEAPPEEEEEEEVEVTPRTLAKRVDMIKESITFEGFSYTRRGTFEAHKLVLATMLTLRINVRKGLINPNEVNALVKKEVALEPPPMPDNLAKFLLEATWPAVIGLQTIKTFENLSSAMESEAL